VAVPSGAELPPSPLPPGLGGKLASPNPARRAVERWWLLFTPIWGAVAGFVMLTGLAEGWGDPELMALGISLAIGALAPPVLRPHESERELPLWRRTGFRLGATVLGFSFGMNYFCTPYFFDVLHMHYGFDTGINIQNNPVFLYLMTLAYFATYFVLVSMAYRAAKRALPERLSWLGGVAAAFSVAALETALNANPFMTSLFCFDDHVFMLWFGTLSYGACFVIALPVWMSLDEERRSTLAQVAVRTLAALMLIVITFEASRHLIAPHVTTVVDRAEGLRDFETSCLEEP